MDHRTLLKRARRVGFRLRAVALRGGDNYCACCGGTYRRFLDYRGRTHVRCPACGSLERHRRSKDIVARLDTGGRILHIAPDVLLGDLGKRVVTFDLSNRADVRGDLTKTPFANGSFDLIVCSHVLEHVPDDAAAIAELHRILSPKGAAFIIVPAEGHRPVTYEDWSITTPAGREKAFKQWDHVRIYGGDAVGRISAPGWTVEQLGAGDFICRI